MKELKFWTAAYGISRQSVQLEFFTEVYELAMVFFLILFVIRPILNCT